jgi:hypothetical protein
MANITFAVVANHLRSQHIDSSKNASNNQQTSFVLGSVTLKGPRSYPSSGPPVLIQGCVMNKNGIQSLSGYPDDGPACLSFGVAQPDDQLHVV